MGCLGIYSECGVVGAGSFLAPPITVGIGLGIIIMGEILSAKLMKFHLSLIGGIVGIIGFLTTLIALFLTIIVPLICLKDLKEGIGNKLAIGFCSSDLEKAGYDAFFTPQKYRIEKRREKQS